MIRCRFTLPAPLHYFVLLCCGILQSLVLQTALQGGEPLVNSRKPNVIIFFIDDLGYIDPVCYRKLLHQTGAFYETPNIDRLANQSVMFTDFYSAHPVCSPTRAALMTGKTPQRVGITDWISQPSDQHLPLKEFTIGEAFSDAGYQTGYIGKWHLGEKDTQLPTAQGFNWMRAVNRAGQPGSYFYPYKGAQRNGVGYWDVPDIELGNKNDYLTDKLTDLAIEFIDQHKGEPFLLCFSHYAVHTPIQSPEQLVEKYKHKREGDFEDASANRIFHMNNAHSRARQDDPKYAAMIENLDTNIGRVTKQLEQLKLVENTIIVFTSDNGGLTTLPVRRLAPTSVRPLRAGKGWNYEGGIRVPSLISWPGTISPAVNDTPAITMDLYPTLLELAGLKQLPQQHLDGFSLVSTMNGRTSEQLTNRFLAWDYPHYHGSRHMPSSAIRKGNWKLINRTAPEREIELYDLSNDLSESENLADSNAETTKELLGLLNGWLESTRLADSTR